MDKRYNLKLDLQFRCNNSKMVFDEFDENTSDFFIQITRQGEKVDISNSVPTLLVLKPSGVAQSQILEVKNNIIYGNLKNSLKNEVGTYIAKLMLVERDKKIFISNISYEVTENALLGMIDNDIVKDERYSVLLQLLERLSNIELQEQTRIDNENSRIEAENLRQEAIGKIKNDIENLIAETNKKVDNNLNTNTSKIDNLIVDTKEELNEYKNNKDISINEDLKEFKESTNKSIENYKTSKDIEINNILNTYKADTTNNINSFKNTVNSKIDKYKNDKDKAINEYIEAKSLELDNYVEAKNKEIDEYKTSKNNEIDLYVSEKNILIDSKISEVDVVKEQLQNSVNNKLIEVDNAEQIRQQEHEERQQFLNGFEGKLNTVVDDVASIKDDVVSVREANKRQDVFLQGLYNENLDGRVTVKEEGSVISLTNSDNGLVDIIGLEGNTLVNYCADGAKELTLNDEINVEGTSVTLTDTVDNGLVDVVCEGSTLVNCSLDFSGYTIESHPSNPNAHLRASRDKSVFLYKENTVYTICINVVENTITGYSAIHPIDDYQCVYTQALKLKQGETGRFKLMITTKSGEDFKNAPTGFNSLIYNPNGEEISGRLVVRDIMVLEGDWTNKEIPPYFEGMKSVAECEDNKLEIVSQSNLADIATSGDTNFKVANVKAGKTYSIKSTRDDSSVGYNLLLHKNDGTNLQTLVGGAYDDFYTFTPSQDGILFFNSYIGGTQISDIMLVEGIYTQNTIPPFKPYTLNKKEITLSEPLRKANDFYMDRFVKIGSKWFIERNTKEVVLDGTQNVKIAGASVTDETLCRFDFTIDGLIKGSGKDKQFVCDTLPYLFMHGLAGGSSSVTQECITNHSKDENLLSIVIKKSRLETIDVVGLNKWLRNNNIKIVIPVATPIYEPLEIEPTINTYNDITHISNNSTIPCNMAVKNTGYNAIIKPSTQYTVAFDTDKSGEVGINLGGSKVTTTNNVATVTTPSTLVDDTLRLTGKGIKASKVRLLEGDKTNYIPSYFEGMKSSFEEQAEEDKYKIEIFSQNKNIFDEEMEDGSLGWGDGNPKFYDGESRSKNFIKIEPNTNYFIIYDCRVSLPNNFYNIHFYDSNFKWLGNPIANNTGRFTTPINAKYMKFRITTNVKKNIQIERSTVITSYTPNKQNKIQFSSIEPLRGVDDKVKDRFVFKDDGKLMIERNCGTYTFNGVESVTNWGSVPSNGYTVFVIGRDSTTPNIYLKDTYRTTEVKVDIFPQGNVAHPYRCVQFYGSWHFCIPLSELKENTTNAFKEWLTENNIVACYQLAEPIYEEVPFELQKIILEGYESGTLFLDTNIPPTVTTSYTANIPVVSKLNKVNETTETNTEDIAITQMAVDFLLMSSLGEEILNFKLRSGYNMASYFASRIIKGALKYEDVVKKYHQYKEDINSILISEGYSDLIVEL